MYYDYKEIESIQRSQQNDPEEEIKIIEIRDCFNEFFKNCFSLKQLPRFPIKSNFCKLFKKYPFTFCRTFTFNVIFYAAIGSITH